MKVIETFSLGEFDIWRDAQQDIKQLQWAQPAHHKAMNLYFQMKRAKDKMKCLDIEILRLLTNLYDDHVDFDRAVQTEQDTNLYLAHELTKCWQYRQQISERIVGCLIQLMVLLSS